MKFVNTLQFRFIVLILMSITPVCILLAHQYYLETRRQKEFIKDTAVRIVIAASANAEMMLENTHRVLIAIANSDEVKQNPGEVSEYLARVRERLPKPPLNFMVIDDSGYVIASAIHINGTISVCEQRWWNEIPEDEGFSVGCFEHDLITGKDGVVISLPIPGGGRIATMRGLDFFDSCVQHGSPNGELLLVDKNGIRLSRKPTWQNAIGTKANSWPDHSLQQWYESIATDGVKRMYYYVAIPKSGGQLFAGVGISTEMLTKELRKEFLSNFFWLLVSATIAFVFALTFARRTVIASVKQLIVQATKLADGDWNAYDKSNFPTWKFETTDFREMISYFNVMAQKIRAGFEQLDEIIGERTSELHETNRELARSNEDLEKFAYVASHDLKAPLRAVTNLAAWIVEDVKLGKDVSEYTRLLKNRINRMENLINALLEYSRVGRFHIEREIVDVIDMLEEIGTELNCFDYLTLPKRPLKVRANPIRLEQVFSNLINNAVKYNTSDKPQITVSYTNTEMYHVFCVADNGPGIDPAFHERIFEIFQTLQPKDESESTGIGLSIVKKIVEDCGGQIWLESDLGLGSKFFFSFQK